MFFSAKWQNFCAVVILPMPKLVQAIDALFHWGFLFGGCPVSVFHLTFNPEASNIIAGTFYPQYIAEFIVHLDTYHQLVITCIGCERQTLHVDNCISYIGKYERIQFLHKLRKRISNLRRENAVIRLSRQKSKRMGYIYDGAFRTMLNDCRKLVILLINEIFGEDYTGDEKVEFFPNEHFIDRQEMADKERITDTNFTIIGRIRKKYHLEYS